MPSYSYAAASGAPSNWELPQLPDFSGVASAGAAVGGAIVGAVQAGGEAVRTGVEAAQRGAHLTQESFRDFQRGLPIALDRLSRAGSAIGQSVQATPTSLESEFVATSRTFGVEEALTILFTGEAEGESEDFKRRRDEIEPAIPMSKEDQDLVVAVGTVVVAVAITALAAPVVVAAVVTAPIWGPIAIIAIILGAPLALSILANFMEPEEMWAWLKKGFDREGKRLVEAGGGGIGPGFSG